MRRLVGVGLAGAMMGALSLGIVGAVTAVFPTTLYRFTPRSGQVQKPDFDEVAQQLAATQERLGVNLANVAAEFAPTMVLVEDDGLTNFRTTPPIFMARKDGRLTEAVCRTTGGTNSTVSIELTADDGTPAVFATVGCNLAGITTPLTQVLPKGVMLTGRVLFPVGVPTGVSLFLTFVPGA